MTVNPCFCRDRRSRSRMAFLIRAFWRLVIVSNTGNGQAISLLDAQSAVYRMTTLPGESVLQKNAMHGPLPSKKRIDHQRWNLSRASRFGIDRCAIANLFGWASRRVKIVRFSCRLKIVAC